MKSTKTNPNSAKGPDEGKIVNKLYCILLTTLELAWLYFIRKKTDMKFIILVSNLKDISPSVFSWKKEYIKKNTMQFYCHCQNTIRPEKKDTKLCLPYTCSKNGVGRYIKHLFLIFTQSSLNSPFCVVFV